MKRGYIVILIVLWALAFANYANSREENEVDIVTAFSNDSFLSTTSHIEAVAMYGNMYFSDEAKKDILVSVAGKLGIIEGYYFGGEKGTVKLIKQSKYAITEISFVTMKNEKDAGVERQYLMTDISILNSLESAIVYRDKVEEIYEEMELLADVTLTLKGNIGGNLSAIQRDEITDDIIKSLDAKIVTQRRDSSIYTVYAYTEGIDDYVLNGTSKTNVNVAIYYDEIADETNIYVATPIINEEY